MDFESALFWRLPIQRITSIPEGVMPTADRVFGDFRIRMSMTTFRDDSFRHRKPSRMSDWRIRHSDVGTRPGIAPTLSELRRDEPPTALGVDTAAGCCELS
jgi:hypothetical protein